MMWYKALTSRYSYYLGILNSLWGLFCIFVICAMFGVIGYWIGQPQFFYAVTQSSPIILDVSSEGDTYYPNVIISGSGKATYYQWIEDLAGNVVFTYKPVKLESAGAVVQHEHVTIPALDVGMYYIKAEMLNQPNPIKSTRIDLTLGIINVVEPDEITCDRIKSIESAKE